MSNRIDLVGKKFGRLEVKEYAYTKKRQAYWKCLCDCGTKKTVRGVCLRNGITKSCGCLKKELIIKRNLNNNPMLDITVSRKLSRILKGRKFSDNHRKKLSENHADFNGENNPNWNSDLTDKNRIDRRYIPEYKQWRCSVYERDNYTCQICGDSIGGNLNSHHIYPWALFESLRFETWNGMALCGKCHRWVHSKKNVDKNYLEEV